MFGITGWKLFAAVGLAGAIFIIGVYQMGVNAERKRGEAAHLRVQLETMRLDKQLAEKALISAVSKGKDLEAEIQINEDALDVLRKAIAAKPEGDRCPASPADLDLLY